MTWRIDRNAVAVREARGSSILSRRAREGTVFTSASAFSLRWRALRIEGPMHCPARSSKFAWMARRAATATETAAARATWRVAALKGAPRH
jgi:hypothetical protein